MVKGSFIEKRWLEESENWAIQLAGGRAFPGEATPCMSWEGGTTGMLKDKKEVGMSKDQCVAGRVKDRRRPERWARQGIGWIWTFSREEWKLWSMFSRGMTWVTPVLKDLSDCSLENRLEGTRWGWVARRAIFAVLMLGAVRLLGDIWYENGSLNTSLRSSPWDGHTTQTQWRNSSGEKAVGPPFRCSLLSTHLEGNDGW